MSKDNLNDFGGDYASTSETTASTPKKSFKPSKESASTLNPSSDYVTSQTTETKGTTESLKENIDTATDLSDSDIMKYGSSKPQRVVIKARVIHD